MLRCIVGKPYVSLKLIVVWLSVGNIHGIEALEKLD